ncbi:MAG TPA: flagellar protein FlgN [Nitrospirae bacterium]|nr:flgN protein [bacterium BMS3Abin06]HDH13239.1 flagellar protein FlgN [Nitrospirota bacterium]HDZ01793.1 flagellar protein FlgN [Nitrospirota bacterium]
MTSERAIIRILKEQINTYKMLHDLLKKERLCLVDINAEKIAEISKEKDTVIMRLRLLEEERIRLITKFGGDNEINGEINLNDLEKFTGNNMFKVLRSQLLSLLQNIEEMNKFNSILIDRSINYLRTTSGFINTLTDGNISQTTGVLLSKET